MGLSVQLHGPHRDERSRFCCGVANSFVWPKGAIWWSGRGAGAASGTKSHYAARCL